LIGAARKAGLAVLVAVLVLVGWELVSRLTGVSRVTLPAPSVIAGVAFRQFGFLIDQSIPTTLQTLAGFFLSLVLGGLLGVLMTYHRLARDALYPNVILFQLIPKVAVAPLFMLWFGLGWEARVAISVFIGFFPIVISTVTGLNAADPNLLRLFRSLTATPIQIFFKVRLPSSLPFIFNGMKISMTLAIIGVIVGEFITSQEGLGYVILFAGSRMDTPMVMAAILVLCIVGLVLYGLVALAEQIILARYGR
jgi:NitT/TauT family transport system permease protein